MHFSTVSVPRLSPGREMMVRMLIMSQANDEDTGIHMFRVGALAAMLALASGADRSFALGCFWAAPMHDIGKVATPDTILKKRGALDSGEMRIMRRHAGVGARILAQSVDPVVQLASAGAGAHHERFDGTGYPLGLRGKSIPLIGRIIAIVDCYDALRMDRCYRQAWSYEAAVAYIVKNAGSHFDPALVTPFVRHVAVAEAIVAEINQFPESGEISYESACDLSEIAWSTLKHFDEFSLRSGAVKSLRAEIPA